MTLEELLKKNARIRAEREKEALEKAKKCDEQKVEVREVEKEEIKLETEEEAPKKKKSASKPKNKMFLVVEEESKDEQLKEEEEKPLE